MNPGEDGAGDHELHAYVDGHLDSQQRAAFEARLANDPAAAAAAAAYARQNAALRAVYDPILREPIPDLLRQRPRLRWRFAGYAAAAVFLLAVGAAGGWVSALGYASRHAAAPMGFAERAALAYTTFAPEVRHPVEVAALQQDHLVAWLSKRLGVPIRAPVLADDGFTLMGGRLLPDAASPAAQFMYEDGKGRRIALYLRVDALQNRETAFRWTNEGNVTICYWIDGPIGYALAGELGREELLRIANTVYHQIAK
jgi:anti-sigma factor RsiW